MLSTYLDGMELYSALKVLTKYFWLLNPTLWHICEMVRWPVSSNCTARFRRIDRTSSFGVLPVMASIFLYRVYRLTNTSLLSSSTEKLGFEMLLSMSTNTFLMKSASGESTATSVGVTSTCF